MEYLHFAGLGAIVLIAIIFWLIRKNAAGGDQPFTGNVDSSGQAPHDVVQPMSSAAPTAVSTQHDFENEVRARLAASGKIEAIKLARERAGLGLKEAKDLVDNIEAGVPTTTHASSWTTFGDAQHDHAQEVRALVAAGRKIEAIKLVRDHTGLGLKEAKDYVERL